MLIRIKDGYQITANCSLFRYFPALGYAFDLGKVLSADYGSVEVCFGDSRRQYCMSEIAYAINTMTGEEHYMTIESGVHLGSHRDDPQHTWSDDRNDPILDDFEEMLKSI